MAVLFDLDDTLARERPLAAEAFRVASAIAAQRYGIDAERLHLAVRRHARTLWYAHPDHPYAKRIGISSWEALWARFDGDVPEIARYRDWTPAYRTEAWARGLAELGIHDRTAAEHLATRFAELRRVRHERFPDADAVLDELRGRGVRLGLVTNGLSCLQRDKLRGAGLAERFDTVVVSGDLGVGKPDPAPMRVALDALGVAPGQALMVGNTLGTDIAAANAAGIRAVLVVRDGTDDDDPAYAARSELDPAPAPDAVIRSLAELTALLCPPSGGISSC